MRAVNHTVSRRIVDFADWQNADLVLEDLSRCRQTMKQRKKQRSDNSQSRHAWAYYDLQMKLEYKQAMNGRQVHYRPPHYTSKTSSVNGELGKRDGNWFKCTSGAVIQADFNSGRNLATWDYRFCPVDFEVEGRVAEGRKSNRPVQKSVSVIDIDNLQDGVFGNPQNLMNAVKGRVEYVQLSLFDCTYN
ncbi:MAG: zinc ribbon domain-containing protein [Waterburya sp.]